MKIYKFQYIDKVTNKLVSYEVATDKIIEDGFIESFDVSEEVAEKIREIESNPNITEMIEKLEIEANRIKDMKTKKTAYNYLLGEIESLKQLKLMADNMAHEPLENILENYGNI